HLEFAQMARLPRVPAQEAAHESRQVRRQARRVVFPCFHGSPQSNPLAHAAACEILRAQCHGAVPNLFAYRDYFGDLDLAWSQISLTPCFSWVSLASRTCTTGSAVF